MTPAPFKFASLSLFGCNFFTVPGSRRTLNNSLSWYACGTDVGMPVVRTVARAVWLPRDYQIFSGWVDLLSHGAPHARALRASWAPLLTTFWSIQELLPKILWNRDFIQPNALKVAFQTIIFAKILDFIWPRYHHSKTVNLKILRELLFMFSFQRFYWKKVRLAQRGGPWQPRSPLATPLSW